jgi:hypothetical protein
MFRISHLHFAFAFHICISHLHFAFEFRTPQLFLGAFWQQKIRPHAFKTSALQKKIAFKPLNSKTLQGMQTVWMVLGRGRVHLIVLCMSEFKSEMLCASLAPRLRRGVGPVLLLGTGGPTRVGLEFKTNPPHFDRIQKNCCRFV